MVTAHQIRNRATKTFQAIMGLQAQRRWCLTGTPVQNRLEDLFSLTEFLRFYPIDNPSNTRQHILNPLGRRDEQALKNLRSLMTVVALRRTKAICHAQCRSDRVEVITLSAMEREQYHLTLSQVRKFRSNSARDSPHTLLSAITNLRQICSHGILGLTADLKHIIQRPEEFSTCRVCGDSIPLPPRQYEALYGDEGMGLCHNCTLDPNQDTSLVLPGTALLNESKSRSFISNVGTDGGILSITCGKNSVQQDELSATTLKCSSKLEKVLSNLLSLQRAFNNDTTPVKRPVQLSSIFSL